jgi:thiamine biosynthesis lipoprotein
MLKLTAATLAVIGSPGALLAGSPHREVHIETGPAFGSAWRLILASPGSAPAARRAVETVVARVDQLMSPFRSDSELSHFNAEQTSPLDFILSPETARVTALALELARASGGAFDPTAAPFGRRFGYGPLSISPQRPAGCYGALELKDRILTATKPGVSLDLCAVAKGQALDDMVRALDGLDYVLELGGEVVARGRHPSGRDWRFGIEQPGTAGLHRIISAGSDVLATSANGQEGFNYRGRRYGHVVDPRAGRPIDNEVASVSVLAPTGLLADGLATAALVLGPNEASELLKSYDARALFLLHDGTGLKELDIFGFAKEATG